MIRTVDEWKEYMSALQDQDELSGESQAWFEGFVCGLANTGELTSKQEDELMNYIHEEMTTK